MIPILSIIIPAYNASKYIERCLDAIFVHGGLDKDSLNLIETIVVDDCSKDNTSEIVRQYAGKNELQNIIAIRHEINRQQGAARNTGLKCAQGNLVWFVDVDDIIMPGFLSILKDDICLSNIDVLQFNAVEQDLEGNQYSEIFLPETIKGMSGAKYLEYEANIHYENRIRASWSKWYRKDFLIHNGLLFEEGVYWEDVVHTLKSIYLSNNFLYLPIIGYVYIQTPNSDMRGIQDGRKFADTIRFCVNSFEFFKQVKASNTIVEFQMEYYERVLNKYNHKLHMLPMGEFQIFDNLVSKLNLSIINEFCFSNKYEWLMSSEGRFNAWRNIE